MTSKGSISIAEILTLFLVLHINYLLTKQVYKLHIQCHVALIEQQNSVCVAPGLFHQHTQRYTGYKYDSIYTGGGVMLY